MGNTPGSAEQLRIKILTGQTQTQSSELFDFHSKQKQEINADLKFPSYLGYSDSGDIVYSSQQDLTTQLQPIYRIERNNFRDIIVRELFQRTQQNQQGCIWKVLGEGQLMQLEKGDVLKIGKIKFTFKQMISRCQDQNLVPVKNNTIYLTDKQQTQRMDLSNTKQMICKAAQGQCRLCFQNIQTITNPLVSLCKCAGSVKFIHYQCLKDWISNNVKKQKSSNCLFYEYLQPNCCQLCKEPLNNQFNHEGQKFSLYQFQKIQPPYAVFQNRYYDQVIGKTKVSVYTVSLPQDKEIIIGRNPNSQVVLKEISVSRNHCYIIYKQGYLYIQDKKSKFGTLVCPRRGFQFNSVHGLQLQYQSKMIQIFQSKAFNNCCCAQNHSYFVEINKAVSDKSF